MSHENIRVFKFRAGVTQDIESFFENYVWFAPLATLNDPYEGSVHFDSSDIDDNLRRRFLEKSYAIKPNSELSPSEEVQDYYLNYEKETGKPFSEFVDKRAAVIFREYYLKHRDDANVFSFSKAKYLDDFPSPLNNMLMWAHYTNGFKGYCVEYDFEKLKNSIENINDIQLISAEIKYATDGTLPSISLKTFMEDIVNDKMKSSTEICKAFYKKEQSWLHENEVRFISKVKGKTQINTDCINAVYLSKNMPNWVKTCICTNISDKKNNIKIYEVHLHESEYKFGFKRIST